MSTNIEKFKSKPKLSDYEYEQKYSKKVKGKKKKVSERKAVRVKKLMEENNRYSKYAN